MAGYERQLFHSNGRLFSARERFDQAREILRSWTEAGTLILEAHITQNEFHGPYRSWWDSGVLKEESVFGRGSELAFTAGIWRVALCGGR